LAGRAIAAAHRCVDVAALDLVRRPWDFDVMIAENMFGDILSDLGDEHGVFQPCYGSALDIAGTGKANPAAMLLSAAMMLDWLGRCHRVDAALTAARLLQASVDAAFPSGGLRTDEFGGADGTDAVTRAVIARLRAPSAVSPAR
jgi:3-isopropylmalate dehydrogenase